MMLRYMGCRRTKGRVGGPPRVRRRRRKRRVQGVPGRSTVKNEGVEVKTNKLSLRIRREIVVRSQIPVRPHQGHEATRRRLGAKS